MSESSRSHPSQEAWYYKSAAMIAAAILEAVERQPERERREAVRQQLLVTIDWEASNADFSHTLAEEVRAHLASLRGVRRVHVRQVRKEEEVA